jgi:DMSO/TMAO reductase YedYZ molybdopterin-dependent catalytic subunit
MSSPTGQPSSTFPNYVVKPTPSEYFTYRAPGGREMNWAPVSEVGFFVPASQYYVHNRVMPPSIRAEDWKMTVSVSNPPVTQTFTIQDMVKLQSQVIDCATDCGANGRRFFPKLPPSGEGAPISGSEWRWGAMGMGRWAGPRLADVLSQLGVTESNAKWVTVEGYDSINYAHTVPIAKALDPRTILAYQLNGNSLPIDNGYPVRAIFPGWGANSNVKWVRSIAVSDQAQMPFRPRSNIRSSTGSPSRNRTSRARLSWIGIRPSR